MWRSSAASHRIFAYNRLGEHLESGLHEPRPGPVCWVFAVLLGVLRGPARSRPPALRSAFEDVGVVEEAVEHGGDGGGVAEEFAPVLDGTVGGEDRARPFVAARARTARRRGTVGRWECLHPG